MHLLERREADGPGVVIAVGRHGHEAVLGAMAAGLDVDPAGGRVADDDRPSQVVAESLEADAPRATRRQCDALERRVARAE